MHYALGTDADIYLSTQLYFSLREYFRAVISYRKKIDIPNKRIGKEREDLFNLLIPSITAQATCFPFITTVTRMILNIVKLLITRESLSFFQFCKHF